MYESFVALEQALAKAPVLLCPNCVHPFHLEMDALDVGLGAVVT